MLVSLNNQFVTENDARISPFDRGFLYGDGIFETILVRNGAPFRWGAHMARLEAAAACLRMPVSWKSDLLRDQLRLLIEKNALRKVTCLARVTISRGPGPRGFSLEGLGPPTILLSLHPIAEVDPPMLLQWRLRTSTIRLPAGSRMAHYKTANRLPYLLAKLESDDAGADEGLMLNTDGEITEGTRSNLFWIEGNSVCTPPLETGILAGITRQVILEVCHSAGIALRESGATSKTLREANGVFLTLTSLGVVEASELDGVGLHRSPLVGRLHQGYWAIVNQECPVEV